MLLSLLTPSIKLTLNKHFFFIIIDTIIDTGKTPSMENSGVKKSGGEKSGGEKSVCDLKHTSKIRPVNVGGNHWKRSFQRPI